MNAMFWRPGSARARQAPDSNLLCFLFGAHGLAKRLLRRGVDAPGLGATARPVITVEFTARIDRHPHGRLVANRLQMVVVELGAEHEIAGPRADRSPPARTARCQ